MTTSAVEICNMALDYLGTGGIVALDEQYNDNAKLCNRWYDITRKSLLKDLNASFAIKRRTLSVLSSTPIYGRSYEYQLPSDCLKLLNIGSPLSTQDYQIEGRKILYDSNDALNIRYVYDCQDVSLFDDEFKECLALYIAANIGIKITQSEERIAYLNKLKKQKYNETAYKYSKDNPPQKISRSKFMASKDSLDYYNEDYFGNRLQ